MTTDPEAGAREQAAATMRAVADLIEGRPDLPAPRAEISYWVSRNGRSAVADVPAALTAITTSLPGEWKASIRRSGEYEWLCLDSVTGDFKVHVSCPASEACAPSGTRTVTTWEPLPAVAALIGGALEDVRE